VVIVAVPNFTVLRAWNFESLSSCPPLAEEFRPFPPSQRAFSASNPSISLFLLLRIFALRFLRFSPLLHSFRDGFGSRLKGASHPLTTLQQFLLPFSPPITARFLPLAFLPSTAIPGNCAIEGHMIAENRHDDITPSSPPVPPTHDPRHPTTHPPPKGPLPRMKFRRCPFCSIIRTGRSNTFKTLGSPDNDFSCSLGIPTFFTQRLFQLPISKTRNPRQFPFPCFSSVMTLYVSPQYFHLKYPGPEFPPMRRDPSRSCLSLPPG